jgi:hypothetical protein
VSPGALPIEGLEPAAAEAFASGASPELTVSLSLAITFKRLVDLVETAALESLAGEQL